jgi:Fis family transcriptional regulator, factor for inversion stimulation protein
MLRLTDILATGKNMSTPTLSVLELNEETTSVPISSPLRQSVKRALEHYLLELGDTLPINLYELVLSQIEAPLLEVVMKLTRNNQSQAAILLGLSRGTLRKKLKQYHLDD